jgi:prepilin-type N-terminal cleavage/methylation domain-containing protein/prepilin-type processing-associated H-X9-DG protein
MVRKKGFTLVELLFVIAIIGIILALLAPAVLTVKRRARAIQRQVGQIIAAYSSEHNDVVPYITSGPEAQPHPKRLYQPSTGVPSLSHFLQLLGEPAELARCPADTGCSGQSYYPTEHGRSCFEDWGQSMLYNWSCYRDDGSVAGPGYDSQRRGPLYGAFPVSIETITRNADYLLAGDFWPHWHFGASTAPRSYYYTNLLFFDFHVEGRHYTSQKEGMAYLNWDGLRRWWVPNPPPFKPPTD